MPQTPPDAVMAAARRHVQDVGRIVLQVVERVTSIVANERTKKRQCNFVEAFESSRQGQNWGTLTLKDSRMTPAEWDAAAQEIETRLYSELKAAIPAPVYSKLLQMRVSTGAGVAGAAGGGTPQSLDDRSSFNMHLSHHPLPSDETVVYSPVNAILPSATPIPSNMAQTGAKRSSVGVKRPHGEEPKPPQSTAANHPEDLSVLPASGIGTPRLEAFVAELPQGGTLFRRIDDLTGASGVVGLFSAARSTAGRKEGSILGPVSSSTPIPPSRAGLSESKSSQPSTRLSAAVKAVSELADKPTTPGLIPPADGLTKSGNRVKSLISQFESQTPKRNVPPVGSTVAGGVGVAKGGGKGDEKNGEKNSEKGCQQGSKVPTDSSIPRPVAAASGLLAAAPVPASVQLWSARRDAARHMDEILEGDETAAEESGQQNSGVTANPLERISGTPTFISRRDSLLMRRLPSSSVAESEKTMAGYFANSSPTEGASIQEFLQMNHQSQHAGGDDGNDSPTRSNGGREKQQPEQARMQQQSTTAADDDGPSSSSSSSSSTSSAKRLCLSADPTAELREQKKQCVRQWLLNAVNNAPMELSKPSGAGATAGSVVPIVWKEPRTEGETPAALPRPTAPTNDAACATAATYEAAGVPFDEKSAKAPPGGTNNEPAISAVVEGHQPTGNTSKSNNIAAEQGVTFQSAAPHVAAESETKKAPPVIQPSRLPTRGGGGRVGVVLAAANSKSSSSTRGLTQRNAPITGGGDSTSGSGGVRSRAKGPTGLPPALQHPAELSVVAANAGPPPSSTRIGSVHRLQQLTSAARKQQPTTSTIVAKKSHPPTNLLSSEATREVMARKTPSDVLTDHRNCCTTHVTKSDAEHPLRMPPADTSPPHPTSQTPKAAGKVQRMHRTLKALPPKNWNDQADLSDDEGLPPDGRRRGLKAASWARDAVAWHAEVRAQLDIDPRSIFGCGSREADFRELFRTPDFKRAEIELRFNQRAPSSHQAADLTSFDARRDRCKKWNADKKICGFAPHEGVSISAVRDFRFRVGQTRDISSLVWDDWAVCSGNCQHDSVVRQPWYQKWELSPNTGKGGSSLRRCGSPLPSARCVENPELAVMIDNDDDDAATEGTLSTARRREPDSLYRGIFCTTYVPKLR